MLMSFSSALPLKNAGADAAIVQRFTANAESLMRALGALAAVDLFLNNSDRVPLGFDNEGNPGEQAARAHS